MNSERCKAHGLTKTLAVLALISALSVTGILCLFPIRSFDIWWHLRTGQLILEQSSIPRTDPFSYTAAANPWVTHEWLSEVFFYGLSRLAGIDGLIVFKALLALLAIALSALSALVGHQARERLPATALGALLAAPLIAPRAFVRPHMFTALLLGATLMLLRLESASRRPLWLWALVPLFLLWANLHSGFVLGFLLLALYWAGEVLGRRKDIAEEWPPINWRRRWLVFILAAVAVLINPHHLQALLYPFKLLVRGEVRETIAELQSIFHPAYRGALFIKALIAVAAITTLLLIDQRHRLEWALLFPSVAFAAMAVRSLRGVSELAILVPAVIGVHGRRLGCRHAVATAVSLAVILLSLGSDIAALRWGVPMGREGIRRAGLGVDPVNCPAGAVRFIQVEKPEGRIFNSMAFGGYLIYRLWPQKQVFVDGRLDIYSPDFLEAYRRLMDTGQGWEEMVQRYDIALTMIDYQDAELLPQGLLARLRDDPGWICVFCGDNALVYARRSAENQMLLDRFGMPFNPSLRSVESLDAFTATAAPEEVQQTIAALERMIRLAPEENSATMILGRLLDRIGRSAEGAARLQQAVEMNPSSLHARLMWVQALQRSGDAEKARQELNAVYRQMPDDLSALLLVADIERAEGRFAEAIAALERACEQEAENYLVHLRLGVLYAQIGRITQARAHLELAQRIRPGDLAAQRNLEKLSGIAEQR